MIIISSLLLVAAMQDSTGDVIVIAPSRKCSVSIADEVMSTDDFNRRAKEWAAGRMVTVIVGPNASYRCMAQIMRRLATRGVTRAVFAPRRSAAVPVDPFPVQPR